MRRGKSVEYQGAQWLLVGLGLRVARSMPGIALRSLSTIAYEPGLYRYPTRGLSPSPIGKKHHGRDHVTSAIDGSFHYVCLRIFLNVQRLVFYCAAVGVHSKNRRTEHSDGDMHHVDPIPWAKRRQASLAGTRRWASGHSYPSWTFAPTNRGGLQRVRV